MSWPRSDAAVTCAIQLAAAAATAFMGQALTEHQQHPADRAAAERRAEVMASLLMQEEARALGKTSKSSKKAHKQVQSSKPGAAKASAREAVCFCLRQALCTHFSGNSMHQGQAASRLRIQSTNLRLRPHHKQQIPVMQARQSQSAMLPCLAYRPATDAQMAKHTT